MTLINVEPTKGKVIIILTLIFLLCSWTFAEEPAIPEGEIFADASADAYYSGTLELEKGWNLISVPRRLSEEQNKAELFSQVNSAGRSIWTYDPAKNGWKDLTKDDKITPLSGYWIYASEKTSILLTFTQDPLQVPPVKDLETGWNLLGFSGNSPASARDSLLSIRKSWTEVIGWDQDTQRFDVTVINGDGASGDSYQLIPMTAYWVYVTEPCTLASIGA